MYVDYRMHVVRVRARMSMSTDGDVTMPSGRRALVAGPTFVPAESRGIRE
jgi:hypothetical protein